VPASADWWEVADLGKAQAEQLLDWLENNGYTQREIAAATKDWLIIRSRVRDGCADASCREDAPPDRAGHEWW
jgi:hypothetical protein